MIVELSSFTDLGKAFKVQNKNFDISVSFYQNARNLGVTFALINGQSKRSVED